jgi:murein DD-endopeptidase MepM/ murein hydrolase activator NlpD
VTTNRLGGNVVWVWDAERGQALYYAHLDRQDVSAGSRVHAGDVLGRVGNTGNARTTPPHLHFGIYRPIEGAIDPLPFICDAPCGARGMAYAQGSGH